MKKEVREESWADFEVFTSKGARIKESWVTITEDSTFLFNAGFVHQANISKSTHVILGYSAIKKTISFQFTSDSQAMGAHTLTNRPGGAYVGSRAFFNYYFLNIHEVAGRYTPKKVKIPKVGEVWAINLDSKLPEK